MSLNLASFAREKYESIVEANVSSTLCCPSTKKNSLSILLPHTGNTNFIHAKIIFRSNSKSLPILNESTKTPKKKRRRTCNYPTYRNFPSPLFLLFILYYIYYPLYLFLFSIFIEQRNCTGIMNFSQRRHSTSTKNPSKRDA